MVRRAERQRLAARVENDAAVESPSGQVAERADPAEIDSGDRCGRLDLDSHDAPGLVFQDEIDFLICDRAEVEEIRVPCGPGRLLPQLVHYEGLEQPAGEPRLLLETCLGEPSEMAHQAGVRDEEAGGLDEAVDG
jgi:hypothetical protein